MVDLSTTKGRLAFVTPIATKFGLEPTLVAAVCEQESDWELGAVRFEPAFLQRYVNPLKLDLLESLDRATSWGLMQIMGQTAREFGYTGSCPSLRDPETAVTYGCKKLQSCFLKNGSHVETALLAYNGGGNPHYALQVIARLAHYAPTAASPGPAAPSPSKV
jgi:soluble lytic murein transglycosylase-like protein